MFWIRQLLKHYFLQLISTFFVRVDQQNTVISFEHLNLDQKTANFDHPNRKSITELILVGKRGVQVRPYLTKIQAPLIQYMSRKWVSKVHQFSSEIDKTCHKYGKRDWRWHSKAYGGIFSFWHRSMVFFLTFVKIKNFVNFVKYLIKMKGRLTWVLL